MNGMYLNGLNFDHCRLLKLFYGRLMVIVDRYDVVE